MATMKDGVAAAGSGVAGGAARAVRDTRSVREALELARLLMAVDDNPVGELVGPAGVGKTVAGWRCAQVLGALRVVGYEGVTRGQVARSIALGLGYSGGAAVDAMLAERAGAGVARRLVVVDEANKLNWRHLELLRYLSDECNVAVLLIGTEMYERQFGGGRTRELLVQLGSRIGAKRVRMGLLDRAEVYAHVIRPALGEVCEKELVVKFWTMARRGNYRDAAELARECARIMAANGLASLTGATLELAGQWMATRGAVEAA